MNAPTDTALLQPQPAAANGWDFDDASDDAQASASNEKRLKIQRENHKLEKRLCREVARAIGDYNMIEDGDKVMVCMSGGKDSYTLLDILMKLRARAPIKFDLVAVNLDQKQPAFPSMCCPSTCKAWGRLPHREPGHLQRRQACVPEGKTTCGLCSRLRRAILYKVADQLGCNKVALGHHRDDIVQTLNAQHVPRRHHEGHAPEAGQ
ncbi:ATP-binding protein [Comamonas sp. JC664]